MPPAVILTVERNPSNLELLLNLLRRQGYEALAVPTLEELDRLLAAMDELDLALIDLAGFDRSIWERCEQLRARGVPVVVVAPSPAALPEGLARGAIEVLVKPLSPRQLLALVRRWAGLPDRSRGARP